MKLSPGAGNSQRQAPAAGLEGNEKGLQGRHWWGNSGNAKLSDKFKVLGKAIAGEKH